MPVRAIRGAAQLRRDDPAELREAVVELVDQVLQRNGLDNDALISAIFTATPDLTCEFPAAVARHHPLMADVPLLCAQELAVTGAVPRIVRLMLHVETDLARSQLQHVYTRGAQSLRTDIAQ